MASFSPSEGRFERIGGTRGRSARSAGTPRRAMWLWNWTNNAAVMAFARAHQVTEIFAYTSPGFTDPTTIPPQWTLPAWPLLV